VTEDFQLLQTAIPQPGPGQALTRTLYLSLDPYQWGRRRSGTEKPFDVCHGRTVSQVMRSQHSSFQQGDLIFNTNGWQEYGLVGRDVDVFGYMVPRKLDPALAPISTAIGVLGMLGLTAWSGMQSQCQPHAGETAVVSAASGGVGQIAGQIAKLHGCRVIGIAGIDTKCEFVTRELGFDACVSHLSDNFAAELKAACPDGINVYFENVGGHVFEAVAPLLAPRARISLCGMISHYGNQSGENPRLQWNEIGAPYLDRQSVVVHDLFVGNFVEQYQTEFLSQMGDWIKDGRVRYKEDLWQGLEQAPEAFMAMLKGGNFGKTLVSVGDDPTLSRDIQARRNSNNILASHPESNP
jgi:NADPH-dependent curcumin reductase CurA